MVIAALICFGALVVAWIMAPDEARTTDGATAALEPELAPIG